MLEQLSKKAHKERRLMGLDEFAAGRDPEEVKIPIGRLITGGELGFA